MTGLTLVLTGTHDVSPLGPVAVEVYARPALAAAVAADLGLSWPRAASVAGLGEGLQYDAPTPGAFGGGLIGSEAAVSLSADGGALAELLDRATTPDDLCVRLSGADGWGGAWAWDGCAVLSADGRSRTAAPAVYPHEPTAVRFTCGLARAEGEPLGLTSTGEAVPSAVVAALRRLADRPVLYRPGVSPPVGPSPGQSPAGDPHDALVYGLVTPDDTLAEALERTASALSLSVYQTLRQSPPRWEAVARHAAGAALSGAALTPTLAAGGSPTFPAAAPGRTVDVHVWGGTEADRLHDRRAPSRLTLEVEGEAFRLPPLFGEERREGVELVAYPTSDTSWTLAGRTPDGTLTLAAGQTATADLGRHPASKGVRFRVRVFNASRYYVNTDEYRTVGAVRLVLDGDDGLTYYATGSGWSTAVSALPLALDEEVPENAGDRSVFYTSQTGRTAADLPASGTLRLQLVGGTGNGYARADFQTASARPADPQGRLITTFSASVQTDAPLGPPATMPAITDGYVVGNGAGGALEDAVSLATGQTYPDERTAQAAERLAQSCRSGGRALRVVSTTVRGVLGPDTRPRFHGLDGEPFEAVFCGGTVRLDHGTTTAVWCEASTAGLAAFVPPDPDPEP